MTKTDDGFCCAFNTISVQSSYASESGEDYDQAEYGDDDYYDYDEDEYYDDGEATTSTESSQEAVTYRGSINVFFKIAFDFEETQLLGESTTTEESTGSSSSDDESWWNKRKMSHL